MAPGTSVGAEADAADSRPRPRPPPRPRPRPAMRRGVLKGLEVVNRQSLPSSLSVSGRDSLRPPRARVARTRRLARMCDCVGRTLLLILMLVGCFTIVLLSPTDSTARPLVLRTKSLHNQVQHASTAVSGSPPLAKKATALRPGPAGDAVGRSPAPARKPAQLAAFVPWDGHRGLERWRSAGLVHGTPRSVLAWKRSARPAARPLLMLMIARSLLTAGRAGARASGGPLVTR